MADGKNKNSYENPMQEDRAREGKKAAYRKMGFGDLMKDGTIDFGDKHPILKTKKEKQKNYENPMKEERFQTTRQADIAKAVGKENVGDPRINRRSGGRMKLKGGGCAQIKGWGKARRR